jgi:hypothetical protein
MEHGRNLQTALAIKNEFYYNTPDVWNSIRKKISEKVAMNLLMELEGLPSCEGRVLNELKNEMIEKTHLFIRMGA